MTAVLLNDVGRVHAIPLAYVDGAHIVPLSDVGGIDAVLLANIDGVYACCPTG